MNKRGHPYNRRVGPTTEMMFSFSVSALIVLFLSPHIARTSQWMFNAMLADTFRDAEFMVIFVFLFNAAIAFFGLALALPFLVRIAWLFVLSKL